MNREDYEKIKAKIESLIKKSNHYYKLSDNLAGSGTEKSVKEACRLIGLGEFYKKKATILSRKMIKILMRA